MKKQILKLLYIQVAGCALLLAPSMVQAMDQAMDQASTFTLFAQGFRGNSERFSQKQFTGIFPQSQPPLSTDFDDAIPEARSKSIDPIEIAKLPWLKKIAAKVRREYVLISACRRSAQGQESDIAKLENLLKNSGVNSENGIFVGQSKGAALGANMLVKHKFQGAILISPFYHGDLAFRDFPPISSLPHNSLFDNYIIPLLRSALMPDYQSAGPQPCDLAKSLINKDTPILIVSVIGDKEVPQYHQIALYIALIRQGFTKVYFYEIAHGDHKNLAANYPKDHANFVHTVQAFQHIICGVPVKHGDLCLFDNTTALQKDNAIEMLLNTRAIDYRIAEGDWSQSSIPGSLKFIAWLATAYLTYKYLLPINRLRTVSPMLQRYLPPPAALQLSKLPAAAMTVGSIFYKTMPRLLVELYKKSGQIILESIAAFKESVRS